MALDLKISQLPAASGLSGAELVELVQGGVNVQGTTGQLGAVANTAAMGGNPLAPSLNGNLNQNFAWAVANQSAPGASALSSIAAWVGSGNTFTTTGTQTVQDLTGAGATCGLSVRANILTSAAGANSSAESTYGLLAVGPPCQTALLRACQNGFAVAGFTMTLYFVLTTITANEQVFMGFAQVANTAFSGSFVPSTQTNQIALIKDAGDTALQFAINNGAGSASKTALTGATLAALQNHLLRLYLTCDGVGNVTMTLTDLESTGAVAGSPWTISYPTATTKLPVAYAASDQNQMTMHWHINNGGTATAVAFGVNFMYLTGGTIAI